MTKQEQNIWIRNISYCSAFVLATAIFIQEIRAETVSRPNTHVYQGSNNTTNTTCLVDRCASCPDFTNLTCTACNSGYYLRSYTSGTKPYNACWSVSKLLLLMFSLLLLGLLGCTLCYLCYKCGQKASNVRGNPYLQTNKGATIPVRPLQSERQSFQTPPPV